jgi:hypothetical protein
MLIWSFLKPGFVMRKIVRFVCALCVAAAPFTAHSQVVDNRDSNAKIHQYIDVLCAIFDIVRTGSNDELLAKGALVGMEAWNSPPVLRDLVDRQFAVFKQASSNQKTQALRVLVGQVWRTKWHPMLGQSTADGVRPWIQDAINGMLKAATVTPDMLARLRTHPTGYEISEDGGHVSVVLLASNGATATKPPLAPASQPKAGGTIGTGGGTTGCLLGLCQ